MAAKFGDITVYSDEYELSWVAVPDYGFTVDPFIVPSVEEVAHVSFNLNYPDKLKKINLWFDDHGEYYTLVDSSDYGMLPPDYNPDGNYSIAFSDLYLANSSVQEAYYMIELEYDNLAGGTKSIESEEFKVTRSDIEHNHVYPDTYNLIEPSGHGYLCTVCNGHPSELEPHVSSGPAQVGVAEVCTVCGYEISPALEEAPEVAEEVELLVSVIGEVDYSKVSITLTTDKGTAKTDGTVVIKKLNATKGSEAEVKAEATEG